MRTWIVLATAMLLLASGCMGSKQVKAVPTETDPNMLPAGVTNILEGTVTGPDLSPIVGANVSINDLRWSNVTDASGFYRFESLPPSDYIITATMEGYRLKQQRAIIEDDAIFQLDFQLEEIPLE